MANPLINKGDPYERFNLSRDNPEHQKMVSAYEQYQEQLDKLDQELNKLQYILPINREPDHNQELQKLQKEIADVSYEISKLECDMNLAYYEGQLTNATKLADKGNMQATKHVEELNNLITQEKQKKEQLMTAHGMNISNNNQDIYKQYNLSQANPDHQRLVSQYYYYQDQIQQLGRQIKDERKDLRLEETAKKFLGSLIDVEDNKKRIKSIEELRSAYSHELRLTKFDMQIAGLEAERARVAQGIDVSNQIYDHQLCIDGRKQAIDQYVQDLRDLGFSDKEIEGRHFDGLTRDKQSQANKIMTEISKLEADIQKFEQYIDQAKIQSNNALQKVNDLDERINMCHMEKECAIAEHKFDISWNSMHQMKKNANQLYDEMQVAKGKLEQSTAPEFLKGLPSYKKSQENLETQYQEAKQRYELYMVGAKDVYENLKKNADAYQSIANELNKKDTNIVQLPDIDKILEEYDPSGWNGAKKDRNISDIEHITDKQIDLDSLSPIAKAVAGITKGIENIIDIDALSKQQQNTQQNMSRGFERDINDRNAMSLKEHDSDIKDPGFDKDIDDINRGR